MSMLSQQLFYEIESQVHVRFKELFAATTPLLIQLFMECKEKHVTREQAFIVGDMDMLCYADQVRTYRYDPNGTEEAFLDHIMFELFDDAGEQNSRLEQGDRYKDCLVLEETENFVFVLVFKSIKGVDSNTSFNIELFCLSALHDHPDYPPFSTFYERYEEIQPLYKIFLGEAENSTFNLSGSITRDIESFNEIKRFFVNVESLAASLEQAQGDE